MKKIKFLTLILLLSTAWGCNSLFDDQPIDEITEETIWTEPSLMDAYLLPIYRNMHTGYNTSISTGWLKALSKNYLVWYTDQLSVGNSRAYTSSTYGEVLKGLASRISYDNITLSRTCYQYIRSVNLILESQDKIENANKDRILGEAYFMRGWYYYRMFTRMGGVMLIESVLNPLEGDVKHPRASFEQMVEFIVNDADIASGKLLGTYGADNAGRIRKGAAIMLKAKTYYWAASERFQNAKEDYLGFPDDRSQEMLQKCAEAYEELFALPDHELVSIVGTNREDIVKEYRQIFLTKHGKEGVFEFNHNNEGSGDGNKSFNNIDAMARTPVDGGTTTAFNPTQNHVNEYRMSNGLPISNPASGYDAQNPYIDRDVRFYANVLYDGAEFRGREIEIKSTWAEESEKYVPGADMTLASGFGASVSNTGYYMAKLLDETFTFESGQYSTQNCIIWRYAEAYLDYAHVKFLLGDANTAKEYVNYIRTRVKEKELSAVTLEDIMNERKVELAFEETTYWDIIRSNEAKSILSGSTNPIYGVEITEKDGVITYTYPVVNGDDDTSRYFDQRQYFLPLSWDDIRYHDVPQNPDWIEY